VKRTALRRKPQKDPVSQELWDRVIMRDALEMWAQTEGRLEHGISLDQWMRSKRLICVVRFLDPHTSGPCSGRQTVEHVKDQPPIGAGKTDPRSHEKRTIRAPSDMRHLVACCWWHNAVRVPSKETRYKLRSWLRRLHPEHYEEAP
jgi:hypothetical protein